MTRLTHHRYVRFLAAFVCVLTGGAVTTTVQAAVPSGVSYQAYLTDGIGEPLVGDVEVTFNLYTVVTGGVPIWIETKTVTVAQGLFHIELGADPFNAFPTDALDTPLWIGIAVSGDAEMAPRRPLAPAPYALKSDDADTLQGHTAADLDQSAHVADTSNPHTDWYGNTDAVSEFNFDLHETDDAAHHVRPSSFADLDGQLIDSQVPDGVLRGTDLIWSNLRDIPPGFDDDTDNLGGDITGVGAGLGVSGGGLSGDVTLGIEAPLSLPGNALLDSGNVGIGLSNPNRPLYIVDDTPGLAYALKLDNPHGGIGATGVGMLFSTGGGGPARGKGGLAYVSTDTWNRGAFHFLQDPNANTTVTDLNDAVMTIANNGNVGIGTRSPDARLDLRGISSTYMSVDSGAPAATPLHSGYRFEKAGLPRWTVAFRNAPVPNPTWLSVSKDNTDGTSSPVMQLLSGTGKVGIGTLPLAKLDVGGDVKIAGDITVDGIVSFPSRTRYLTIPPAAFVEMWNDDPFNYDWTTEHGYLEVTSPVDTGQREQFVAPVHLPNGATVTRLTAFWVDTSPENSFLVLRKGDWSSDAQHPWVSMVGVFTDWADNEDIIRATTETTIEEPVVDNEGFNYGLYASFWDRNIRLRAVRIDYTTTLN